MLALHVQAELGRPTSHTTTTRNTESKDDAPYLQLAKLTCTIDDIMATSKSGFFDLSGGATSTSMDRELSGGATSTSTKDKATPRGEKYRELEGAEDKRRRYETVQATELQSFLLARRRLEMEVGKAGEGREVVR